MSNDYALDLKNLDVKEWASEKRELDQNQLQR